MDKVSILGWYFHHNIGDDAMLEGLQYTFNKAFGVQTFDVMNGKEPVPEIQQRANKTDLFLLGGGELIHANKLYLSVEGWEQDITVPKTIYGCGSTATELQPHVVQSLDNFNEVYVRDRTTQKTLQKYGIDAKFGLDPSLALMEKYGLKHRPVAHRAVVIPTDRKDKSCDPGISVCGIVEKTKDKLKEQLEKDGMEEVILLPFGEEDNIDYESCQTIAQYLRLQFDCTIVDKPNVRQVLQVISTAEKVYSYRLHGCLFAWMLQIPFIAYRYHTKIDRMLESLCIPQSS